MTVFGLGDLAFLGAAGGYTPTDATAAAYITAVESADGQALESAVRQAIDEFVIGCKADGIWNAIKASCILAGARTLSGALVPLVGTAPTNVNFVAGDYNRKTGLKGDGATKFLDANRNNNNDPQNNNHQSILLSEIAITNGHAGHFIGAGGSTGANGATHITGYDGKWSRRSRSGSADDPIDNATLATGFAGISRSVSTSYNVRRNGGNNIINITSQAPFDGPIRLYTQDTSTSLRSASRLAFYSIGESLDLAKLDSRVTTLINAFGTAIA